MLECLTHMAALVSGLYAARHPPQVPYLVVPKRVFAVKRQPFLPRRCYLVPEAIEVCKLKLHADCSVPFVVTVSWDSAAATRMVKRPINWVPLAVRCFAVGSAGLIAFCVTTSASFSFPLTRLPPATILVAPQSHEQFHIALRLVVAAYEVHSSFPNR